MRHRGRGAVAEIPAADKAVLAALFADVPAEPGLLIEHLHWIQDRHGGLPRPLLHALGEALRLPDAAVYEVATFYHGFRVLEADEAPLPTIQVCDSIACAISGAAELEKAAALALSGQARVEAVACLGRCDQAPCARVQGRTITRATPASVEAALSGAVPPLPSAKTGFDAYLAAGGYTLLREVYGGARDLDGLLKPLEDAGLRGLGGAGFPTGRKWRAVAKEHGPRLMAVNADESEPGTFKDRFHLLADPHRVIEGMLLGAWAVGAEAVYVYLRDEYEDVRAILRQELARLPELGLPLPPVYLRRGAGNYICGEESAMLESLEGKRGLPRHKPPYPSQVGLFGRPTLINNVETLYWVRDLVERGPDWWGSHGVNGGKGLRSFSVSGRVRYPGVKLVPAGISARELIEEYAGGMQDGHEFKAFLPGGASGGILPASLAHLPLDFGTLDAHGAIVGSAAFVVLSDQDSVRDAALNLMRFFKHESCGQCTPCRLGTEKAEVLMRAPAWDQGTLKDLGQCMADASICGLGQAAPSAFRTVLRHFPEEVS
ncbi:NADH-quinone oxidoreductase subunit F [Aerophototrophica crusticola]|uniref:NADH-quinone oxidoreductase subunit F n=2 Tax=Aerophototrophica crusticola TaxID=1709002 RepID=A0A858RBG0_9PROT|nr:NADH-quinone oxidoreductase subunit F [Rhodospirillaceae bacterium B3]